MCIRDRKENALPTNRLCCWCGAPAEFSTYRTIYVDTEYEQASRYFECAACHQKATKDLISEVKNNVEQ